jgi:integrase
MEDKIDIHKTDKRYESALSKLEKDENINSRNKELILKFLQDCKDGRTLKGRSKKKLGKRRILKYLFTLKKLSKWLDKPFDKASQAEMEKLVSNIEENVYKNGENNYSEETKLDFKQALQKFYKWLGQPELVEFMDMSETHTEVPAISREEVEEKLINSTPDNKLKAAIMVLFDGGARAEEFLNLRLKDLTKRRYENNKDCYFINIRYSKTFARTIPLPLSSKHLNEWLADHPERDNSEAQLFPFTYPALRKRIKVLAEKCLKKRLTIHMLRHSSATYWAPKMNRYQLCAKYGWAFSSDMPDRYIKRKGIIFDEIAEKGDVEQTTKLQKENRDLNEKMEKLEQEYKKIRRALEFIMPVIMEKVDDKDFKRKIFEKRKEQLVLSQEAEKPVSDGSEIQLDFLG